MVVERHAPAGAEEVTLTLRLQPHGNGDASLAVWSVDGIPGTQTGSTAAFRLKAQPEPYTLRIKLPDGRNFDRRLIANRKDTSQIELKDGSELK